MSEDNRFPATPGLAAVVARYTPGPWVVEPLQSTQGADLAICAPNNGWVVAVIQHDPDIQVVEEPDGDTVVFHPADRLNAAVIAEGPAMVEILKELAWGTTTATRMNEVMAESRAILRRCEITQ